jgi:hypothetical protein
VGTSGREVGTKKGGMKVYMVDAFHISENRRMKPVEIVLRREGEKREN